jgi:cyclophilin family peptidyl-prolyl cis-trans isomerase
MAGLALGLLLTIAGCGRSENAGDPQNQASIKGGPAAPGAPALSATAPGQASSLSDPLHPVVAIDTSLGKITVTLDKEKAPITVDNFLHYVETGFYDQTIFHQVFKDYVILGGSYTSDLKQKQPGVAIFNEANRGTKNLRGTIAMARVSDVIDSATCQFFINISDNDKVLDYQGEKPEQYGYCAFGQITEGMEVADQIASLPVQDQGDFERIPTQTVTINSIRRIR